MVELLFIYLEMNAKKLTMQFRLIFLDNIRDKKLSDISRNKMHFCFSIKAHPAGDHKFWEKK